MSPLQGFALWFVVTLVLLVVVVVTGRLARRRIHITCVALTVVALGVTIRFALAVGKVYDLHSAGIITPIHLTLAKITTAAYLAPIATGLRTLFVPSTRRLHAKLAYAVLALTVVCAVTGTIMILRSKPL